MKAFVALLLTLALALAYAPQRAQADAPDVPSVTLHLSAEEPNTTWFTRAGSKVYKLCTAPCDVRLSLGAHHFGIGSDPKSILWTQEPSEVRGPTRLAANRRLMIGSRAGGVLLLGGGLLTSIIIMGSAQFSCSSASCARSETLGTVGGALLGLASVVLAAYMLGQKDYAEVREVTPVAPSSDIQDEPRQKPRFAALSPAVWACLRDADAAEATLALTFDAAHTLRTAHVRDVPAAQACVSRALEGQRVEHAPAGGTVLRFRVPR